MYHGHNTYSPCLFLSTIFWIRFGLMPCDCAISGSHRPYRWGPSVGTTGMRNLSTIYLRNQHAWNFTDLLYTYHDQLPHPLYGKSCCSIRDELLHLHEEFVRSSLLLGLNRFFISIKFCFFWLKIKVNILSRRFGKGSEWWGLGTRTRQYLKGQEWIALLVTHTDSILVIE